MGGLSLDDISKLRQMESSITLGVCSEDFSLIHDYSLILNDRGIAFQMLAPGKRSDGQIDALVLDRNTECPVFEHRQPPIINCSKATEVTIDRAVFIALGRREPDLLVIGIDPGKRPGMAFIIDGFLIKVHRSYPGEDLVKKIVGARSSYRPKKVLIRIGDGDPSARDSIIEELDGMGIPMELVDERRTSISSRFRDEIAALKIAHTSGVPI